MSDNPIQTLLERAVDSYGSHLDEREKFELSACIFSMVMIRLGWKAEQGNCSLMIILVLSIWENIAHDMFLSKEQCATVLMDRAALFRKAGESNWPRQLSGSLVVAHSYRIPLSSSEETGKYSFDTAGCDTSESHAKEWIESVNPFVEKLVALSDRMESRKENDGVLSLVHRNSRPAIATMIFVLLAVVLCLMLFLVE